MKLCFSATSNGTLLFETTSFKPSSAEIGRSVLAVRMFKKSKSYRREKENPKSCNLTILGKHNPPIDCGEFWRVALSQHDINNTDLGFDSSGDFQ
jgi:hypothetical protein